MKCQAEYAQPFGDGKDPVKLTPCECLKCKEEEMLLDKRNRRGKGQVYKGAFETLQPGE